MGDQIIKYVFPNAKINWVQIYCIPTLNEYIEYSVLENEANLIVINHTLVTTQDNSHMNKLNLIQINII